MLSNIRPVDERECSRVLAEATATHTPVAVVPHVATTVEPGDCYVSLARGEGLVITEASMRQLAEEVHQRGLTRLAAEKSQPRGTKRR